MHETDNTKDVLAEPESPPQDVIEGFRLSAQQKEAWLRGGQDELTLQAMFEVGGPLDARRLEGALGQVVDRHEILRTRFQRLPGMEIPIQVISGAAACPFRFVEVGEDGAVFGPEEIERLREEELRALGSEGEANVRCLLIRRLPLRHVLILTVSALSADARSLDNLLGEVVHFYGNGSGAAEDEPLQYVEFSEWQAEIFAEEEAEEEREFWRDQTRARSASAALPLRKLVAEAVDVSRPHVVGFDIPSEEVRIAKSLAEEHDTTLRTFVLMCWVALLTRLSERGELTVEVFFDGRKYEELEQALGPFGRYLPLTFRAFAERLFSHELARAAQLLEEAETAAVFFPVAEDESEPVAEPTAIGFDFESKMGGVEVEQLTFDLLAKRRPASALNLRLVALNGADGLRLELHDTGALYEPADLERLATRLGSVWRSAVDRPKASIAELQVLSPQESELLDRWNRRILEVGEPRCLAPLFAQRIEPIPEAIAVVGEAGQLSFRELDRRATGLAAELVARGVGPESRVGLYLERSPELVIALLAVWKTGAAFLPIELGLPEERLAWMLIDAEVELVVSQRGLADNLPCRDGAILRVDNELPLGSCGAVSAVTVHPENLAYVIYTSGSTGRPKGVLVEHRSVANLSVVLADAIDDGLAGKGPLRVAVNAPLAFDASIKQVIQLLAGSTLVLIPEAVRADGKALVTILDRERVDVFDCTPSQLRLMLAAGLCEDEGPAFPQRVLLGGEPIDGSSWEQLAADRRSYFNVYGPTECTVDTTARRVTAETAPSLGRPLANIRVEILDARLRRLPLGMAGELCIGGAGVARGYLARPGLTAACFVPDAFAREHEPGSRIYRSGDQARFGAQGEIEFIGRLDGQVKLRGVRLELGEIDFALTRHPGVAEAVTVVRDDPPIGQRLVGYVTPVRPGESAEERPEANPSHPDPSAHDEELSSEGLRGFLRRTLPEVMVPTNVVILDQLPLTVNGKIDRAALPAPEAEERPIQEARTPSEELLVGIWSELLGRERVGTEDNFFELGGHSLLATQVTSRVRSVFGVELPLRVLFEHPTVAGLAVELDVASRAESGGVAPPIERLGRETAPLSFAQQRLWFIDQMEPGSPKYNLPSALRLTRELRIDALAATFSEIVRRHETLRTSFPTVDGKSVQVIAPPAPVPLPVIDLEGLDEERRDAEAQRWAAAASNRPFDLQRGPVLRLAILRLAAADHVLLLTMHHIAGDGWSMEILIREVSTLYAAFVAGRPSPLPELQFQYADYAVWQRQWLSGEVLKAEVEHWRSRLAGAPPVLELPSDRPRPAVASYGGASLPLRISDELMASLSALCQREGVTLFMLLLAVYQALLSRWSGQSDISVGTAIAGRNREETEGLIGFFVNTLVLRLRLDEDLEVRSLLRKVREETLEAQAHQELPFEKLVEELQPNRNLSHTPLFQVTFGFQRTMSEEVVETMSGIRPIVIPRNSAKFELAMALRQQSGRLSGGLSYATDLFDHTTILRMSEHYVALLGNLADSLESRFLDLEILSPGERFQLVVDCNDTRAEAPLSRSITALFDERVANAPEAVAVIFEGETLTYGMLARRAEALAHRLRAAGVGRGDFVALYAERSPSLLIALLAILETGSAYVPLDPGDPPERLAAILRELGSPFLLSAPEGIDQLPSGGFRPLPLDAAPTAIEGASPPAQRVEVTGDDAAYVIFTSGSTGRPKGVAVPHHAVIRLVRGADYVQLGVGSRVAQASVATFDAATFEIWGALLNGGALVGVPKEKLLTASSLSTEIRRQRIDTLFVTTALFNQLVAEEPGVFSELENLLFGGEAVDPKRVSEAQASRPPRRLLHVYGPTETTTFATWYRASSAARRQRTLPIGWPIANSSSYVLDRGLRPVPIGVVGELLLGGEGLSWGYWGRPGLSASRYVPDLFGAPGSRLYRSGDLVRSTVEGAVEFVGRVDHQVKLRGFRIEMGEIEAVLSTHPWVRETVVVLRHDPPAPKRLIAYWAGAGTSAVDEGRLRDFLVPKLPEYMVPAAFVRLEALPLNINGKVDRAALPVPAPVTGSEPSTAAPRTPTEEILSGIWSDVLGVEEVGVEDDFFESGGHSLMATQVISRIHQAFQVRLSVNAMFETPTLKELATQIETKIRDDQGIAAPPIEPVSREQALPLSFAQQRLWFIDQLEPGSSAYNIPSALRFDRALDPAVLAAAFGELVRRHESLRTSFPAVAGEAVQRIAPPVAVPLPVVDLRQLSAVGRETEARRLTAVEARRPFELAQGPVLRQGLVRLGNADWVLWVTVHHIASDGWSMGILKRELLALYEAFAARRPSPLEELPVQYADFAVWQRHLLSGEALAAEIEHWRGQLAGAPAVLDLPLDRPRPPVLSYRGTWRASQLPEAASLAVGALSRRQGTTLFMTLLAAFQALLSRWSGQTDICVGTPIAGRNRFETEDLIGFFVNTLVLRTRLDDDPSTLSLLARVREMALAAYAHQDLPFEKLVEEILPERSMSHSPLFQVMFTLNAANATGAAPSAGSESTEAAGGVAKAPARTVKFELTLGVQQEGDRLRLVVDFSTDLFDTTTIDRMLGQYHNLVAEMVEAPDRPLSALRLISQTERAQILVELGLGKSLGTAASVAWRELFTSRLEQSPEAIAVVAGDELLSYRELDRRAANWGHQLAQMGAGPEVPIGVSVERSPAAIEALLGIFAVGGIYVPLDTSLPAARRDFILADAGIEILLTRTSKSETMRASWLGSEAGPRLGSGAAARPENTAYVIYTSGSSGRPKGVCVDYGSLARYLVSMQDILRFDARDRVLQFSSLSFDASLEQILASLGAGASLVLRQPELGVAEDVLRWIVEQRLSVIDLPPVVWADLAQAAARQPEILAGSRLRWVITGGEAMPVAPLSSWWRGGSRAEILNAYGPTEAVIAATAYRITRASDGAREQQPIGRPLSGRAVYVQDRRGRTVPLGVNGELTVGGGVGLANGYLGRPALTAQAFVPDAQGGEPGSRLYRTGDLARFLPSGDLEFLGRIDQQVKVRGFRIELGEIEVALQGLAEIHEAVVMVRASAAGDLGLVAYVVPEGQGEPDVAELQTAALRQALQASLPDYMVPSVFVTLDVLPLTPNGKIDREALLAATPASGKQQRAPRTMAEEILCGIWSEVLDRETVGVDDDFFELGGHSLLATRVISRIRTVFQRELPVRALFEAPTVAKLAALVEGRLHEERDAERPALERISRDGDLPLSFAQQRLWFIDQLQPGSWAYNMPSALRFDRVLDPAVLAAAFGELVRRHESLRTSFPSVAGEPTQRIASPAPVLLPVVDLEGLPEADRELEARRLTAAEMARPFDLARGPVLRHGLLRLGSADWVLLVTMHHIASDGWSMDILTRELSTLYEAFAAHRPSPLRELPIQYADYAAWQRRWLAGEVLDAEIEYWRRQLAGAPPALEMPTDRPRPAVARHRGALLARRLPEELAQSLAASSRRRGTTLFMTFLAAWQAVLSRWSGQNDISVGTPIAGRNRLEIEGLIGFFVNTLVLRTRFDDDPGAAALLERVRETTLEAYAHQDLPFEKLVEELQPERNLSRSPLFQTMLVYQNTAAGEGVAAARRFGSAESLSWIAKFEITLVLTETGRSVAGSWRYDRDLYDAATIERLAGQLEVLLAEMVAHPEQRLSQLALLGPAERHQVAFEWNDTASGLAMAAPEPQSLSERFEARVERTPDAIAVVDGSGKLSFQALDQRAERLAGELTARGIGPESRVGLYLERSAQSIVALTAIWKAGAAYLPLDLNLPRQRLGWMLADADVTWVLSQRSLADDLPHPQDQILLVDEAGATPPSTQRPAVALHPENLAYVIYTSGSTGRPKGVLIEQRSVANLVSALGHSLRDDLSGKAPLRVGVNAPLAFDASVKQLIQLLEGHTLILVAESVRAVGEAMLDLLERQRVDVLDCTPSQLRLMLAAGLSGSEGRYFPRRVLVGGEAIDGETWDLLAGDARAFFNVYGPTECTVDASLCQVRPGTEPRIGRALPNVSLYVLDASGQQAPLGVAGELRIGGAGVCRGYLERPALTADKVGPDPFGALPGARLYRTGDLVRHRTAGDLEFLGRLDGQVKLRGARIELGEIEAVLCEQTSVAEAAVVVREDRAGDQRLVAYVVPDRRHVERLEESLSRHLRQALRQRLPAVMVPASVVALEKLPLNPSGKVDRRALPEPKAWARDADPAGRAAGTPAEEMLAGVWSELLQLRQVGMEESFFELGGHSLLATQVMSRVRSLFGVEIPLRALFEKPTVAGLATEVEEAMRTERGLAEPLTPVARGGEMPLSFAQQRLWFIDQLQPGSSVYNIPLAQRFERRLDPAVLAAAFGELVRRHESLRTSFPSIAGEPRQQIAPPSPVSLPVVDLEGLSAADIAKEAHRLTMAEASRPFDLAQGPVLRHGLLRLEKADWVLLVTMHHIASDGWSMRILRRELSALYEAFAAGRPSPLEALPIQYADYAVWQRNWLSGELLSAEIEHWRGQLSGAPPVLELPTDRPRPAVVRYRAASRSQQLPEGLAQSLTALSRRQGTTLFMTFLAAYQVLLSRWSGQADISVGTPIAGRNRLEIEGLIGFFVNTLVLRTHLDDDADSISLLAQVRDTTLEAHAHQDLPFEKLVEELQPERSLSHSPLFQTMLVFQNMTGRRTGAGRELGSADALSWNAKFEMTLALAELDDTVAGVWEYDRDLYDASTVARLAGQFEVLLAEMVAHPQQRLSQLALLQPAERHQLVAEWSHTSAAKATAVSVPELVAARASRAPDALAVVYSDQALSYGELNVRANRLAGYLVDLGVGPGARVGLCLDRSLELVVAVLAVFKAGGAYVPLDPEYPADRLAFMAADSDLSVLVTRKTLRRDFVGQQVRVVELDTLAPEIAACSSTGPRASARLNDLAYVLYTSGSTGKPKGVMVSHRGLANLAEMQVELFGLGSDARVLQFASLSFDASIWEIVMAWRAGACLVEAPKEALLPGESLDSLLRQQAITVVTLPPTALAALSADLPVLEVLVVAGEACPEDLARQWATGRRFFNAYGPTEATVCSTAVRFAGDGALTIGRPLEGSRTYLLDRRLEALPIGVGGELCIGGVGLAQGYLGRPGLTAERFVPDPLGGSPGGRLYRTGDRVRAQRDGALEFLGRLDHQVKLRGFRIELGEIEAALAGQATVHEAVVVARDDAPGGRGLVAYVVPKEQDSPSSAELRMALQASLPEHMVPSAFVAIESLPLLPNGKIDRKALPAPTLGSEVTSRVPRDRVELELVQIWEALLGIPQVDVQASFFELGGHSLLAVRLIEQIRERFGATLPVAVLFERPTIEGLAALLHREGAAPSSTPLVTLQGEGAERPFFCVHPVGGNVFCYLPLAKHLGSRQPFFGLQSLDREEGHGTESIEAMAGEYIAAMRGAQAHGPYRIGGWSMGGFVAFEMARQLLEMGEEIEVLALFDSVAPSVSGKVRRKTDEVLIAEFVRDLGALSGQAVDITPEELRSIPAEDLWGHVTERARAAQALAPEIEPSTLRRYFEVFARNRRAMVAYRPGIFPGSLTLFAVEKARRDPDLGWDALAAGGVEVVTVAGDHYSMLREPRVRNVGQQLGRRLSRAVDTSPTDRPAVTESSSVPIAQRDPVSDIEPVAHLPKSSKSEELNS